MPAILLLAEVADKEPEYSLLLWVAVFLGVVSVLLSLLWRGFSVIFCWLFFVFTLQAMYFIIWPGDFDRMVISEVGRLEFALKSLLAPVAGLVANLILLSLSRKKPQPDTVNPCHS
jgi:hypothetical protein